MDRLSGPGMNVASEDSRREALAWLRGAVAAVLDVAPLSGWMKRRARSTLRSLPDRLLERWARALNMDSVSAYKACPDFAQLCRAEQARDLVQGYFDAYDVVPVANNLDDLAHCVAKQQRNGRLPLGKETVERQVCALAWGEFVPLGAEFMPQARDILRQGEQIYHVLIDYHLTLDSREVWRLQRLDQALSSVPYGAWVGNRLEEVRRWLGVDEPIVRIQQGQRTPLWELLWENLLAGGENDRYNQ